MDNIINKNSLLSELTLPKDTIAESSSYAHTNKRQNDNTSLHYKDVAQKYNKPEHKRSEPEGKSNATDGNKLPKEKKEAGPDKTAHKEDKATAKAEQNQKEDKHIDAKKSEGPSEHKDPAEENEDENQSDVVNLSARPAKEIEPDLDVNAEATDQGIAKVGDTKENIVHARLEQSLKNNGGNTLSEVVTATQSTNSLSQATTAQAEPTTGPAEELQVKNELTDKQGKLTEQVFRTQEQLKSEKNITADQVSSDNVDNIKNNENAEKNITLDKNGNNLKAQTLEAFKQQFESLDNQKNLNGTNDTTSNALTQTSQSQSQTNATGVTQSHQLTVGLAQNKGVEQYNQILTDTQHNKGAQILQSSTLQDIPSKVHLMLNKNENSLRIMLEPPDLGQLEIKVHRHDGSTNIMFNTQMGHTKELIEGQLNILKDALTQQGVQLGDVNVYQDNRQGGDSSQYEDVKYTSHYENEEPEMIEIHYQPNSGLDLFV